MASMIGIPARMNTASCREKWPTSFLGTIFFVISKLRTLFFSFTSSGWKPRSRSARCAAPEVSADSTPETFLPSASSAV